MIVFTGFDRCTGNVVECQSGIDIVDVVEKVEKVEIVRLAYPHTVILVPITKQYPSRSVQTASFLYNISSKS